MNIPFQTKNWTEIPKIEFKGESESAFWLTLEFPGLRIRIVEYIRGYLSDHWCRKRQVAHFPYWDFFREIIDS